MKNKHVFTAVLLCVIMLCAYMFTNIYVKHAPEKEEDSIAVVTSFYPMYIATANIVRGCEGITVQNLSEPQTGCLHDFQLTPEDMKLLSTADVFVANGGGMESFLEDVVAQYPNLTVIETMETELEEELHENEIHGEEAHTHAHNHANAHAWMSVSHYRHQVEVITEGLCEAIMVHNTAFEELIAGLQSGAAEYDEKLAELEGQQKALKEALAGEEVISFHDAYAFVAEDYGLDICYTMNLDEERQISAGEVADVLDAIEAHGANIVLAEELYGSRLAETVEKETDVKICYLDTLTRGEYDLDSYINGMQENIRILSEAFGVE